MKMDLSLLFHDAKNLVDPADENMSMASLKTNTSNATELAANAPVVVIEVDTEQSTDDSSITDPLKPAPANAASGQRARVSDPNG